jgi:hypothetical protein
MRTAIVSGSGGRLELCGHNRSSRGLAAPRLGLSSAVPHRRVAIAIRRTWTEGPQSYRVLAQTVLHAAMYAAFRIDAIGTACPGRAAGQQLDPLVDMRDGPDVKVAGGDSGHHLVGEHEVRDVGARDRDALLASQAAGAADGEEALDLRGDPRPRPARVRVGQPRP